MANDATVYDGFISLLGGMQAGIEPSLLQDISYALGVNVTSRRGLIQTRPGFTKLADVPGSVFQGAGRWSLDDGDYLAYVVDGEVRVLFVDTQAEQTVVTGLDATAQCYFVQVDRWMVVQNGLDRPVVLAESGGVVTAARDPIDTPSVCLVPGTVGVYAHNRYHYVPTDMPLLVDADSDGIPDPSGENGRVQFVSSDVRETSSAANVFQMTEHMIENGGGGFSLPLESGYIYAMGVLRNADTGTGVGPVIVFGREGVSAFDLGVNRTQWLDTNISQAMFRQAGTRSPWSLVSVNGDLLFIDTEGQVRSLRYAASEGKSALTNTTMSYELSPYLNVLDLDRSSSASVDNRFLGTVAGTGGGYFSALASLDFAPVYAISVKPSALWDGLWTGFKFLQVLDARLSGRLIAVAFVKTAANGIAAVYLNGDAKVDLEDTPIESILATKSMFGGNVVDVKKLRYCELWLSGLESTVALEVLYRPEGSPRWYSMGSRVLMVPTGTAVAQARRRIRFTVDPADVGCMGPNGIRSDVGEMFQFAIRWVGWAKIERFRVAMDLQASAPVSVCSDTEAFEYTGGEDLDPYSYEVPV